MYGCMDVRMYGCRDVWVDGYAFIDGFMYVWISESMDGLMNVWISRLMD